MATYVETRTAPRAFAWRRVHSLMGLWFLIFLTEHLFTNSQAALFFGNDAMWFVRSVNFLRNIPYLPIIEVVMLGIPILYHTVWGIWYMFSSRPNSMSTDGTKPSMKYARSRAYTWQRLSSWVILVGIILHVVQMRVFDYPYKYRFADEVHYYVPIKVDSGLYPVADRLNIDLYSESKILAEKDQFNAQGHKIALVQDRLNELRQDMESRSLEGNYNSEIDIAYQTIQKYELQKEHLRGLESRKLKKNHVMAVSKSFGSLELINVRQTFQSVIMCLLYTLFVAASVFHGFNGLWTFLITWGIILSKRSQSLMSKFCTGVMFVVGFLGFMSIWGTYFLTLRS